MRSISYLPSTSGGGIYRTCKSMENYRVCIGACLTKRDVGGKKKRPYQNALDAEEQHQLHLGDFNITSKTIIKNSHQDQFYNVTQVLIPDVNSTSRKPKSIYPNML
ncbi:hypothetical protein EJB05_38887, partial [Eragrostis curvula]